MINEKEESWISSRKIIDVIVIIALSYFSVKIYYFLYNFDLEKHWIGIPLTLFLSIHITQKLLRKHVLPILDLLIITILSAISTGLILKISVLSYAFSKYEENIVVGLFFVSFTTAAIILCSKKEVSNCESEEQDDLFNLFYINTSKVHEIAMLIDNKIMKTVEKQRSSQQLIKRDILMDFTKIGIGGPSINQTSEHSNQKSVYESFDVKTTKSIMLRTIYSSIKKRDSQKEELGNILLFKNVELKQHNTDDTVMVLNVLKDGNMKQLTTDENFELNLSKMMDEMLDDFTIDYTFDYKNNNYLLRIPYKSKEHFENSYSHNDLQLGKLSIIGIYRGKLDFSNIDSISSKFLDIFSGSYNDQVSRNKVQKNSGLLQSSEPIKDVEYEFKIEPSKLAFVNEYLSHSLTNF